MVALHYLQSLDRILKLYIHTFFNYKMHNIKLKGVWKWSLFLFPRRETDTTKRWKHHQWHCAHVSQREVLTASSAFSSFSCSFEFWFTWLKRLNLVKYGRKMVFQVTVLDILQFWYINGCICVSNDYWKITPYRQFLTLQNSCLKCKIINYKDIIIVSIWLEAMYAKGEISMCLLLLFNPKSLGTVCITGNHSPVYK